MNPIRQPIDIPKAYEEHLAELKSYLYRLTCDKEITNDLAQDTFIKVIEKQNQFEGQSGVKTWIFSIATNLAVDWLRKRKRWTETAQDESKALAQSDPIYRTMFLAINQNSSGGAFDFKEHIGLCFTCISKTLQIEHQVTLILKDIYDFKVSEISIILSSPVGTIKHWLFSARQTMTEVFERRCALVNKEGVCYQCSELNGLFNPRQKKMKNVFPKAGQEKLYELRTELVKGIDPLNSKGSELEDSIMQVLRKAISDT
ncbi:MAG TPA: RNA polymerase subunit sigma-24 [Bacteroidetes bacterium]|nr:RNA polymerase subunit sigma-24 [Bacteroidota bacterium]